MGTRSAIGYALPDGRIRAVYCHWDGSPSHQLPILQEHYNTLRKAQALIRPGSMSSLRTTNTWNSEPQLDANGRIDFELPYTDQREAQPLYHHERGDVGPWDPSGGSYAQSPWTGTNLLTAKNHWASMDCEFLYIYKPKQGWFHYDLHAQ